MPAHQNLEAYLDAGIKAAGVEGDSKSPFFRSDVGRTGLLTERPMHRVDAYQMIRRRVSEVGLRTRIGCHSFRATSITAYLEADGSLENAQTMAAHEARARLSSTTARATKSHSIKSSGLRSDETKASGAVRQRQER